MAVPSPAREVLQQWGPCAGSRALSHTLSTDTALLVSPGPHPFPATATELTASGLCAALVVVTLTGDDRAGKSHRFRRQHRYSFHRGAPPPRGPGRLGVGRQAGGPFGRRTRGWWPSGCPFCRCILIAAPSALGSGGGDEQGAGSSPPPAPAISGPWGGSPWPGWLPVWAPASPPTDLGATAGCGSRGPGVGPESFIASSSLWGNHGGVRSTPGHGEVGQHHAPGPPSTASSPEPRGSCRGLRKRHLPSPRSCQVFFKGLQVSGDQMDVKISSEAKYILDLDSVFEVGSGGLLPDADRPGGRGQGRSLGLPLTSLAWRPPSRNPGLGESRPGEQSDSYVTRISSQFPGSQAAVHPGRSSRGRRPGPGSLHVRARPAAWGRPGCSAPVVGEHAAP